MMVCSVSSLTIMRRPKKRGRTGGVSSRAARPGGETFVRQAQEHLPAPLPKQDASIHISSLSSPVYAKDIIVLTQH